ncbi:MAG: MBOAT family O-acyltransferase [Thermoanaerobaculaceae bacterium]|jgi:alginate O-acetyltransferase complex protein AlgI
MLFTSPTFLFVFLPAFLAAYLLIRLRLLRNGLLLVSSLFFYAWGEGCYALVLLVSILANYLVGLWLERARGTRLESLAFWIGVALNLMPLIALKFGPRFLASKLDTLLVLVHVKSVSLLTLRLPAGISFFTFMALSYLIALHRREVETERNPLRLGLYISLFPLIMAGPICRYKDLAPQLAERLESVSSLAEGARRFIVGLGKKVLIANTLATPANAIFGLGPPQLTPALAWFGLACYTLQIFFDFSGYSDMAIGLGRMLGFRFMENFDAPYAATSVRAFWSRWHISLSTWFRDYLFLPIAYPVGRAVERIRFARLREDFWAYAGGSLATMFLIGLWHGASWGFVAWGLYHGAFLVFERTRLGKRLTKLPGPVQHAYLLMAVTVGWVLFRTTSVAQASTFLAAMAGHSGPDPAPIARYALADALLAVAAGVALSTRIGPTLRSWMTGRIEARSRSTSVLLEGAFGVAEVLGLAALLVMSLSWLSAGTYAPFIYFRF